MRRPPDSRVESLVGAIPSGKARADGRKAAGEFSWRLRAGARRPVGTGFGARRFALGCWQPMRGHALASKELTSPKFANASRKGSQFYSCLLHQPFSRFYDFAVVCEKPRETARFRDIPGDFRSARLDIRRSAPPLADRSGGRQIHGRNADGVCAEQPILNGAAARFADLEHCPVSTGHILLTVERDLLAKKPGRSARRLEERWSNSLARIRRCAANARCNRLRRPQAKACNWVIQIMLEANRRPALRRSCSTDSTPRPAPSSAKRFRLKFRGRNPRPAQTFANCP